MMLGYDGSIIVRSVCNSESYAVIHFVLLYMTLIVESEFAM